MESCWSITKEHLIVDTTGTMKFLDSTPPLLIILSILISIGNRMGASKIKD